MKNGYRVYISSAVVKGKEWMRLRVGFFGNRSEASAAGKKITSLLEADGAWVDRLGEQEIKEFGGY
jgi:septal ring-binding cell division protein DamX